MLSAAAFAVYLVAVFQLDPIVRWLWPIPVAMFVVYPYLKRFTWLCHLWLGACLGLAPVGAWLAVSGTAPWEAWALGGAVLFWVAGFDLFYSLYDLEHDLREGLHSWAARFGERGIFFGARALHVLTVVLLAAAGAGLGGRRLLLAGRGRGRGTPRLRALARPARRPPATRRGVLHGERRHQPRLLRLRRARRARLTRDRARAEPSGAVLDFSRHEPPPPRGRTDGRALRRAAAAVPRARRARRRHRLLVRRQEDGSGRGRRGGTRRGARAAERHGARCRRARTYVAPEHAGRRRRRVSIPVRPEPIQVRARARRRRRAARRTP